MSAFVYLGRVRLSEELWGVGLTRNRHMTEL